MVKNEVVKKTVYNELFKKGNAIQVVNAGNLVKKADYNTKIAEIEKKILDHDHSKYMTTQEFNLIFYSYYSNDIVVTSYCVYVSVKNHNKW